MKKTNANKKVFIKKLHILLAGMFATTVATSSVQAVELVEIEPMTHTIIINEALVDLSHVLSAMTADIASTNNTSKQLLAKEVDYLRVDTSIHLSQAATFTE